MQDPHFPLLFIYGIHNSIVKNDLFAHSQIFTLLFDIDQLWLNESEGVKAKRVLCVMNEGANKTPFHSPFVVFVAGINYISFVVELTFTILTFILKRIVMKFPWKLNLSK